MTGRTRLVALYFGFAAAIAQVLLVREFLAVLRGNELVIGAVFSAWFFGIFAGARWNPARDREAHTRTVGRALILLPLSVPVFIYLLHSLPLMATRAAGEFYSTTTEFLLGILCAVPIGFLVGRFFPPLVALDASHAGKSSGGHVYAIESFGSFAGGLAFAYFFVDRVNPLGMATILILCALPVLAVMTSDRRPLPLMVLPLALLVFSGPLEKILFEKVWSARHGGTLVSCERTVYQSIQIEDLEGTINVYGNNVFYYSLPDRYGARGLFHLIGSLRPLKNSSILMVGGGPGALPVNLLRTDIALLHYCEPDVRLWDAIKSAVPGPVAELESDPRFMLVPEDVPSWLRRTKTRYDFILCLAPPPESAMLNRFYTAEFYRLCASRLGRDGVFLTSVHGFSNYMGGDVRHYIAALYRSFTDSFTHTLYTSGDTMLYIGAKAPGVLPRDGRELAARHIHPPGTPSGRRLDEELTRSYSPRELLMFFEETQLAYFRSTIPRLAETEAPNTATNPRIYWRQLMLTLFQERSLLYALFRGPAAPAALVLAASLIALLSVRRRRGGTHAWGASLIFCTGFVSISLMLTLMLAYQHFYGVIYHRIALMNALYMLGLGAGSLVMTGGRYRLTWPIPAALLGVIAVFMTFLHMQHEALFWTGTVLLAVLSGAVFPGVFSVIAADRYHEAASTLDAIEHFGSIAGSLLTPAVLIHSLGMYGTITCSAVMIALMLVLVVAGPDTHGGPSSRPSPS